MQIPQSNTTYTDPSQPGHFRQLQDDLFFFAARRPWTDLKWEDEMGVFVKSYSNSPRNGACTASVGVVLIHRTT